MTFGLYQGQKLGSQEIAAYRRGLNVLLLPRLLSRLQQQLQANANKPDYLYQALKICLMLDGQHPIDRGMIKEWMGYDWEAAYPGPANEATRVALKKHLDVLLEEPLAAYDLNGATIEQARRVLRQVSLTSRAYALLQERAAAAKLAPWRVSDHAGPGADRVLTRGAGKLLSDGLPGLYTREGFYGFVVPTLPDASRLVEEDSWVLGDASGAVGQVAPSGDDILKLYYADYTRLWDELIASVSVAPTRGNEQAAESLNLLSGPNSPLRVLWRAVADETRLSQPISPVAAAPAQTEPAAQPQSRIGAVLAPTVAAAQPHYGEPVDRHFRDFHDFVNGIAGGQAPMDEFLKDLSDLYQQLNRTPGSGGAVASAGELGAAARKVEADAARLPASVGAIAQKVAHGAAGASAGGTKTQINDDWQKVLPLCLGALDGRYPLDRNADADVTPDDFARLFSPGGLIDAFFKNDLAPFVDTSRTPWRGQGAELGGVAISPDALAEFQLAAKIRDSFFGTGATPVVRFEITPLQMDSGSKNVMLSVDGQEVPYEGGAARPMVVQWPGPGGIRQSAITFENAAEQKATLSRPGTWSWFRLLDAGQLDSLGGPDRWRVTFTLGNHKAVYEIHAGSVMNPLATRDLDRFRCPRRL
jgi:type VI secretion system protein ImpL